uniref:NADPH oxidase 5 n=1 Tax=Cairina moschata TaxID=8855 RepID=A0A8C3CCV7_CAIMO
MSAGEDAAWLRWVAKQFESMAGEDRQIHLEEFKAALKVKESFFAERLFALFDSDGSGTISLEELLSALSLLVHGSETDKLRFLFQVYDVDGSGAIDPAELRLVLRACLRESAVSLPPPRLDDLARALFEAADKDGSGSITFEELRAELEAFPGVMENLSISAVSWLKPPPPPERSRRPRYLTAAYWHNHGSQLAFLGGYTGLNLLLFTLAALRHAGLGGWVAVARGCGQCLNFNCAFIAVSAGSWVLGARFLGGGLPTALAIPSCPPAGADAAEVPELAASHPRGPGAAAGPQRGAPPARGLRGAGAGCRAHGRARGQLQQAGTAGRAPCPHRIPPDGASRRRGARRHGLADRAGAAGAAGCHARLLQPLRPPWRALRGLLLEPPLLRFRLGPARPACPQFLEVVRGAWGPLRAGEGGGPGCLPCRGAAHRGGQPAALQGDAPRGPAAALVPLQARGLRLPQRPGHRRLRVAPVHHQQRPRAARCARIPQRAASFGTAGTSSRVGDPLVPAVPPRATGCCRPAGTIWLHVRARGQWTSRLHEYCRHPEVLQPCGNLRRARWWRWAKAAPCARPGSAGGSVATGEDGAVELTSYRATGAPAAPQGRPDEDPSPEVVSTGPGESRRLCSIKCYIDGPYGTPTRRIFTSEHAVLIGAGIGITPFASILQSIMYRYRLRKQSHDYEQGESLRGEDMTLRKVDFIWINRDQKHFEWFISLLAKLELEQAEQEPGGRFLELHLYLTAALGKSDVRAVGLQLALDLLAAKEHKDSITGLRARTQPGRPDWSKVFGKVAEERKGKVQVFFCGSPALAKVIRAHCERFGFRFFKENF